MAKYWYKWIGGRERQMMNDFGCGVVANVS